MNRWSGLLCSVLAIGACSCNTGPRALQWELEYTDPVLEADVLAYRLAIIAGGCPAGTEAPPPGTDGGVDADASDGLDAGAGFDGGRDAGASMDAGLPAVDAGFTGVPGTVRYEVELRRGEVAEMNPPVLAPGGWGFLVEARDGSCGTVAVGCTPLDLPLEGSEASVTVRLAAQTLAAPCQPGRCIDGLCGMPDASVEVPDGCIPRDETCNRADDDCDGYVDEDFDLQRDTMNCGSCGNFCPPVTNGAVTCEGGACRTECEEDFSFCPGNRGTCDTDLSQPVDCGSCGNFCPAETPICGGTAGARRCVDTCGPGQLLCGRSCVDPVNDANHCGACNVDCSRPNAVTECAAGGCVLVSCVPDYEDCDGDLDNGCEQYTREDENNCGGCGIACPDCQSCSSGTCTARSNLSSCLGSDGVCIGGACCGGCYDDFRGDRAECEPGTTAEFCGSGGEFCRTCGGECETCATGSCEPAADGTACTDGVCSDEECCRTCVDASGVCRPSSATSCGTGGAACVACACANDTCSGGTCGVGADMRATAIDAGDFHTCALRGSDLFCWGDNELGQAGLGATTRGDTPFQLLDGLPFRSVATGPLWTCAGVSNLGTRLLCWGQNESNQAGSGPNPTTSPLVFASPWSGLFRPAGLGGAHGCGTHNADLRCWGNNDDGQLGLGNTTSPGADPEVSLSGVSDAEPHGGARHMCIRTGDRRIRCAGNDDEGQLGNGPAGSSTSWVDVPSMSMGWDSLAVGAHFGCAVRTDSTLWCWGSNASGQLGNGSTGGSEPSPVQVGTEPVWHRVFAGTSHACAIRGTGGADELWCWGDNRLGQIGNGAMGGSVTAPVRVGTSLWATAAPGGNHTCAIDDVGAVYCWGQNNKGQLGIAGGSSTTPSLTPERVCFP
ncbi:MAG: hypothetical protein AB8I08_08180 [Sandaracinaceae bacterium]